MLVERPSQAKVTCFPSASTIRAGMQPASKMGATASSAGRSANLVISPPGRGRAPALAGLLDRGQALEIARHGGKIGVWELAGTVVDNLRHLRADEIRIWQHAELQDCDNIALAP